MKSAVKPKFHSTGLVLRDQPSIRCQTPKCGRYFQAQPWHTGDRAKLCGKCRRQKAEAEAAYWIKIKEARELGIILTAE